VSFGLFSSGIPKVLQQSEQSPHSFAAPLKSFSPYLAGLVDLTIGRIAPNAPPDNILILLEKIGAGEAIRTPDPNLGKVMLYP
jgi:hypothetical protein